MDRLEIAVACFPVAWRDQQQISPYHGKASYFGAAKEAFKMADSILSANDKKEPPCEEKKTHE